MRLNTGKISTISTLLRISSPVKEIRKLANTPATPATPTNTAAPAPTPTAPAAPTAAPIQAATLTGNFTTRPYYDKQQLPWFQSLFNSTARSHGGNLTNAAQNLTQNAIAGHSSLSTLDTDFRNQHAGRIANEITDLSAGYYDPTDATHRTYMQSIPQSKHFQDAMKKSLWENASWGNRMKLLLAKFSDWSVNKFGANNPFTKFLANLGNPGKRYALENLNTNDVYQRYLVSNPNSILNQGKAREQQLLRQQDRERSRQSYQQSLNQRSSRNGGAPTRNRNRNRNRNNPTVNNQAPVIHDAVDPAHPDQILLDTSSPFGPAIRRSEQ